MNKIFKLYLLFLACSVSLFSQSFFEKVDNSSSKLSLEEIYYHDIKKSLDDGEISVSSTFYQIKNDNSLMTTLGNCVIKKVNNSVIVSKER